MLLATDLYFDDSAIDRIGDYLLTFLSASLQLNKGESYTGRSMTEIIVTPIPTVIGRF